MTEESPRPTTAPSLQIHAAGSTDIGQARVHNEDAVLLRDDIRLYVVADGAGGHNAGNVASALATTSIANFFEATQLAAQGKPEMDDLGLYLGARRLAAALQRANRDIVEIAKTSNKYQGMGTTVVAAYAALDVGLLHVAHVGDSRCYRLRAGQIEQLTYDHSLLNDVLELRPDLDDAKLAQLPRHVVTRALGMAESVRVSVRTHALLPGDRFLLCSDGLTDMVDDETIGQKLGEPQSTSELVKSLIATANFCGGEDNIAALVLACEATTGGMPLPIARARRVHKKVAYVPPDVRGTFGSAPEIIIVGTEDVPESDPHLAVVPAESATPSLRDAFAGLTKRKAPRPE